MEMIDSLTDMQGDLQADETELLELSNSVIEKLRAMTDEDFDEQKFEIVGDVEQF